MRELPWVSEDAGEVVTPPSVYRAYLHIAQFWDGRARNVEAQASGPILNPVEMNIPGPEASGVAGPGPETRGPELLAVDTRGIERTRDRTAYLQGVEGNAAGQTHGQRLIQRRLKTSPPTRLRVCLSRELKASSHRELRITPNVDAQE